MSDLDNSDPEEILSISSNESLSIEDLDADYNVFDENYIQENELLQAIYHNDLNKVRELVSNGRSLRVIDNDRYGALHTAVLVSKDFGLEMTTYLLSLEKVEKNERNSKGFTPLLYAASLAVTEYQYDDVVLLLINTPGVDLDISTYTGASVLQYCIIYSAEFSKILIEKGVDIDHRDNDGDTALHYAVMHADIDMIYMLLYYNADTTCVNKAGLTAFMLALYKSEKPKAEVLFEYEVDLNLVSKSNYSTLFLAIKCRSFSYISEMIDRGADVNFNKNKRENIFSLDNSLELEIFKKVWDLFDFNNSWFIDNSNIIVRLLSNCYPNPIENQLQCIEYIIENSNPEVLVNITRYDLKEPILSVIVRAFYEIDVPYDRAYAIILILLTNGLQVYNIDLNNVYEIYGHCELFELLLHMDRETYWGRLTNIFPSLIHEIIDVKDIERLLSRRYNIISIDYDVIFQHTTIYPIRQKLKAIFDQQSDDDDDKQNFMSHFNSLPSVPSLQDLARNMTRNQIHKHYKTKNISEFYFALKSLRLPKKIEQLIKFEVPLYEGNYFKPELISLQNKLKLGRKECIRNVYRNIQS